MVVPLVGLGAAQAGPPVAVCEASEPLPEPGETVILDASASQSVDHYRYDLDGDGRYEDVTDDGRFNVNDVAVFLDAFDRPVVRENPALFDFDGSGGGVNIVDVAELLDLT